MNDLIVPSYHTTLNNERSAEAEMVRGRQEQKSKMRRLLAARQAEIERLYPKYRKEFHECLMKEVASAGANTIYPNSSKINGHYVHFRNDKRHPGGVVAWTSEYRSGMTHDGPDEPRVPYFHFIEFPGEWVECVGSDWLRKTYPTVISLPADSDSPDAKSRGGIVLEARIETQEDYERLLSSVPES